ncbi:MAG: indole-3-glycerol phosphate synthase TrpC [Oscillospiraceae bacterium]|nr:indole-3-glycerol phosphate synthase TrpC [Oscillospiraceae bacterium]
MILDKLVASSKERVRKAKEELGVSEILKQLEKTELKDPAFANGLVSPDDVSVIAEIKKASPSKGLIREDFDHIKIAREYSECNIQAMSVLTEPEYFKGDIKFIPDIKSRFNVPVLRKDFTVDEYQIYEAKLVGADAILLIMAALTDSEYKKFHALADELKLDVLVETHNEEEVKRAVEYGKIIGVNNRNLQTFEEDITTCEKLLPLIPENKIKVAESAIRSHADFEYLRKLHYEAALIGEAFMRSPDIKKAVNILRYGN